MSKVKELLEKEENLKNWTLDEVYELQNLVNIEWLERKEREDTLDYLNQATSFNEFRLLMRNSQYYGIKETPEDRLMGMWIDFIEGKDNSK